MWRLDLEMAFILWHCTHYCIAWHLELCRKPMVATVPVQHRLLGTTIQLHTLLGMKVGDMASHRIHCIGMWSYVAASSSDRTSTASFIGHNDAASYLVGYEGRSSCAFICIFVRFCGLDVMEYIAIYYE